MVILGIDTAIRRTGYGVVRMEGNRIHVLDCGVIKNAPSLKHSECLRRIYMGIKELVDVFKPDAASIEMAFVGKNVRTTMILSMARGVAIASASNAGVPVYEYSPKTANRLLLSWRRSAIWRFREFRTILRMRWLWRFATAILP